MKKLYAIVFALMLLFSTAISAAALEYKTTYRENGMGAYADWSNTENDVTTYSFLGVTNSDEGNDIYVSVCTDDIVNNIFSCKSGYVFTQEDVFRIDRKLDSASLSAVDVVLYDWDTGSVETVSMQAEWTGIGDISKGSYKFMSKYEDYISKSSGSSSSREAIVTGSINGNELGTSGFAGLAKFKSVYTDMKK